MTSSSGETIDPAAPKREDQSPDSHNDSAPVVAADEIPSDRASPAEAEDPAGEAARTELPAGVEGAGGASCDVEGSNPPPGEGTQVVDAASDAIAGDEARVVPPADPVLPANLPMSEAPPAEQPPPPAAPASPEMAVPSGLGLIARTGRGLIIGAELLFLAVVALLLLAPGIDRLPVTDRDEARFVQATKQMVESGDWIDIRFQDEPRYKKPIGIHWLQGAAVLASGEGGDAPILFYRLPSLVAAVAAVLIAYGIGLALRGPGVGFATGLLTAGTLLLGVEARLAKTDAVLLAAILAAQWALASLWMDPLRRRRFGRSAVFWTALGLGILVKGPIILLVSGATLVALSVRERSLALFRALSPVFGVLWTLALVLPWFVAIGWISNGAFFREAIGGDLLAKAVSGQESHGAPPGVQALAAAATFWPLAALVPAAIAFAIARRREPAVFFLIAWIVPGWIVFEAVATKLPNYVLPFLPAFAALAGLTLAEGGLAPATRWRRFAFAWVALGAVAAGIGLNAGFVWIEERASVPGLIGAVLAGIVAIVAWRLLARGWTRVGIGFSVFASGLLAATAYAILLPDASRLWPSDRLAEAVAEARACDAPAIYSVGYAEPSLVVRLGTGTKLTDAATAATGFATAECAVALVDRGSAEAFVNALAAAGAPSAATARTVEARSLEGMKLRTMNVYVKP